MERFRWQRSKLVVQHAAFPRLGAFIPALLFIFLVNLFRNPNPLQRMPTGYTISYPSCMKGLPLGESLLCMLTEQQVREKE